MSVPKGVLAGLALSAKYDAQFLAETCRHVGSLYAPKNTCRELLTCPKFFLCIAFTEQNSATTRHYVVWGENEVVVPCLSKHFTLSKPMGRMKSAAITTSSDRFFLGPLGCKTVVSANKTCPYTNIVLYLVYLAGAKNPDTDAMCFSACTFETT
jgi:hypothetical protein